jgi:hypothetical protein
MPFNSGVRCENFSKWYYPPFARVNPRRRLADYFRNRGGILPPAAKEDKDVQGEGMRAREGGDRVAFEGGGE